MSFYDYVVINFNLQSWAINLTHIKMQNPLSLGKLWKWSWKINLDFLKLGKS